MINQYSIVESLVFKHQDFLQYSYKKEYLEGHESKDVTHYTFGGFVTVCLALWSLRSGHFRNRPAQSCADFCATLQ